MATLKDLADSIATKFGIPTNIFSSLIGQESGAGAGSPYSTWNPNAVGANGEQGLGQLLPTTSAELGVLNPFDPMQNLTAAATYLKAQFTKFGSWQQALAAYNGGPNGVNSAQAQQYAATVLGGAGLTGSSAPGIQGVPAGTSLNSMPGGSTPATSSAIGGISIYIAALFVILLLVAFGLWAVVRG